MRFSVSCAFACCVETGVQKTKLGPVVCFRTHLEHAACGALGLAEDDEEVRDPFLRLVAGVVVAPGFPVGAACSSPWSPKPLGGLRLRGWYL